jgi:hypothetical protein
MLGIPSRYLTTGCAALAVLILFGWLGRAWMRVLTFDDAYMFYRYALNIRHGLGISWNPDGVPTYGMTSLPWVLVILPLTYLSLTPGHALQLASWLVGTLALIVMAVCVARHTKRLHSPSLAFAVVALPLVVNPVFGFHLSTGMDTVLSLLANAVMVWALLEYLKTPSTGRASVLGSLMFAAILTRPDNGLCAMGSVGLAWLLLPGPRRWQEAPALFVLPLALMGAELWICRWYFQVPLPLGFYAKSLRGYVGFLNGENAVEYAYMGLSTVIVFLGALGATVNRKHLPLVIAFLLPVVITTAYLLTVRQVMGFGGRYYVPFIPYAVIPACLSVDAALTERGDWSRRIGIGVLIAIALFATLRVPELGLEHRYKAWVMPKPIPVPALPFAASEPLPADYNWVKQPGLSQIVAHMPPGAVIAASEVGYLGAIAPQVTLIDLVGLNDTTIGTQGFSMDNLLARAPDLIWLPQEHYTGLLATLFSDPRFLQRFVVIATAFDFGIAIRCDSPLREDLERQVSDVWPVLYPSKRLADYRVSKCSL